MLSGRRRKTDLLDTIAARSLDANDDHRPGGMVLASPFHASLCILRLCARRSVLLKYLRSFDFAGAGGSKRVIPQRGRIGTWIFQTAHSAILFQPTPVIIWRKLLEKPGCIIVITTFWSKWMNRVAFLLKVKEEKVEEYKSAPSERLARNARGAAAYRMAQLFAVHA